MAHMVKFEMSMGNIEPHGTICGRKFWEAGDYPLPWLDDQPHCAKCQAQLERAATAYHLVETNAQLQRISLASKLRWLHEYEAQAVYFALRYLDFTALERSPWRLREVQERGLLPEKKQFVVAGVIPLDSYDEHLLESQHDDDCACMAHDGDCDCGWLKYLDEHPEEYAPRQVREVLKATNPQDALMRCSIRRELWDRLTVAEVVDDPHDAAVKHWQATGHECEGQGVTGRCLVCGWRWERANDEPAVVTVLAG